MTIENQKDVIEMRQEDIEELNATVRKLEERLAALENNSPSASSLEHPQHANAAIQVAAAAQNYVVNAAAEEEIPALPERLAYANPSPHRSFCWG